jgi:hypothetical protein
MLVSQGFVIALVRAFFQALIHAADVFSCLPEAVVISTHHYKLALDVLKNPNGTDHQNIRNFIEFGWDGISFDGEALKKK